MKKIAIGILLVGLIVAVVGSGFLVADYSYQKGYSKGHFEGFRAGAALESDCWMCTLIGGGIAYVDNDRIAYEDNVREPPAVVIPYLDGGKKMLRIMRPHTDPIYKWDASWVYAGYECGEHRNEIVELYRENPWAGYIK